MRAGRRVVVTGLGQVSASGTDLDAFWRWVTAADPAPVSTPVTGFDPRQFLTTKAVRRSDPFARYGVGAARLALADAALEPGAVEPRRGAVVLSTVYGALESLESERDLLQAEGPEAVSPNLPVASCENVVAAMVSADLGWRGPSRLIVTACAGGTHAVSEGADLVASGRADLVVAGGTQGRITPVLMAAYTNLRVLSPSGWVRPFDRRRDGFVFAEGAAALILEPLEAAQARGARIYAEVLGSGHTNDAASLVSPTGTGAVECIGDAIDDAGIDPAEVVHVNAHGTGTLVNDLREAEALHEVFGARPPAVSSIKRVLGHAAGASGAFEAVAAALTVHTGVAPSLGTDVEPDEALDLDLITGPPRRVGPGPVLSNSFGLGGHNGCLILGPVR
ncbi:beta-ketoacyl-[acyl-carrier-protein] synthase family protein [Aquihabitans sp. McL0605]|uniref:beta-ketoacyl-[acyl-carrier-protein] synthase family protein n=1 Tax=Aquihabitans sp. McL0605 TaxID=3415671 RepID=UPI003CE89AB8